jgi:hypothetical protein
MITNRTAAAIAAIGLALSLSACSSSGDTASANAAYCEGAAKVQSEVDQLQTLLKGGASAEAVKAQAGMVQSAIEANSVPLSQLTKSVKDEIAAADQAFSDAVQAIPEGTPVAEAAPQYKAAIDAWNASIESTKGEVGCS